MEEAYYKKNLCWIVQQCGTPLILCDSNPYKNKDKPTTDAMQKIVNSVSEVTNVEWFREALEESDGKEVEFGKKEGPDEKESAYVLDKAAAENPAFIYFPTTGKLIAF